MSLTIKTIFEKLEKMKREDQSEIKIFIENAEPHVLGQQAIKYLEGNGVKLDFEKAILYLEASAAKSSKDAYYLLGSIFVAGRVVTKNKTLGMEYLLKASEMGHNTATLYLGQLYYDLYNKSPDSIKDYDKAAKLFTQAKDNGDARGSINLGVMYLYGHSVPKDYKKAQEIFELGRQQGSSTAINNLGFMYESGFCSDATQKSAAQTAFKLYQGSAEKNDRFGLYNLGRAYQLGIGTVKDINKAKACYLKASNMGHIDAYQALNNANYDDDLGVTHPLKSTASQGPEPEPSVGLQSFMHFIQTANNSATTNSSNINSNNTNNNVNNSFGTKRSRGDNSDSQAKELSEAEASGMPVSKKQKMFPGK